LDKGRNKGHLRDYITTSNLYWGYFDLSNIRQMPMQDEELERCTVRKGDLLICEGGEAGRASVWSLDNEVCFQNHIHRARFYYGIDSYFAYRYFEMLNATGEINKYRKGVTISNMSGKALASIPFPLAPTNEQKRIVAKVDQLMALCDQLEAQQKQKTKTRVAINNASLDKLLNSQTPTEFTQNWQRISNNFHNLYDNLENLTKLRIAILQLAVQGKLVAQEKSEESAASLLDQINAVKNKLVNEKKLRRNKYSEGIPEEEKPYHIPPNWKWVRLSDVYDVRDGTHDSPKYHPQGFPLVTSKNLSSGRLELDNVKYISKEDHEKIIERSKVDKEDILFAMIGSIGNPVIVDVETEFSIKNVALFKYYDKNLANPRFLNYYLHHAAVKMKEEAAGGVQSFVPLGFLREYPFPLPSLEEQKRIVAKVDQLMTLCNQLESRIKQANNIQQKLTEATVKLLAA